MGFAVSAAMRGLGRPIIRVPAAAGGPSTRAPRDTRRRRRLRRPPTLGVPGAEALTRQKEFTAWEKGLGKPIAEEQKREGLLGKALTGLDSDLAQAYKAGEITYAQYADRVRQRKQAAFEAEERGVKEQHEREVTGEKAAKERLGEREERTLAGVELGQMQRERDIEEQEAFRAEEAAGAKAELQADMLQALEQLPPGDPRRSGIVRELRVMGVKPPEPERPKKLTPAERTKQVGRAKKVLKWESNPREFPQAGTQDQIPSTEVEALKGKSTEQLQAGIRSYIEQGREDKAAVLNDALLKRGQFKGLGMILGAAKWLGETVVGKPEPWGQ